jgi:hypothetical protein
VWHAPGTPEEVSAVLEAIERLPEWWPSVYLGVEVVQPGDAKGIGQRVRLWTKGWLPYTLLWSFTVVESRRGVGYTLYAEGDFVGTGVWRLEAEAGGTQVTFDWDISARKPLLWLLTPLLRPLFAANHRWAMARGEESLRLELERRRGQVVARPPLPTWPHRASVPA